jgi:hypothetical protein
MKVRQHNPLKRRYITNQKIIIVIPILFDLLKSNNEIEATLEVDAPAAVKLR